MGGGGGYLLKCNAIFKSIPPTLPTYATFEELVKVLAFKSILVLNSGHSTIVCLSWEACHPWRFYHYGQPSWHSIDHVSEFQLGMLLFLILQWLLGEAVKSMRIGKVKQHNIDDNILLWWNILSEKAPNSSFDLLPQWWCGNKCDETEQASIRVGGNVVTEVSNFLSPPHPTHMQTHTKGFMIEFPA